MKVTSVWDRKLWGIAFMPELQGDRPHMIGDRWNDHTRSPYYPGEPTRALLFDTRKEARDWIATRKGSWGWQRYRVIRVREVVRPISVSHERS